MIPYRHVLPLLPLLALIAGAAPATAQDPLRVPLAPTVPILVDGQHSPGEWDEVASFALGDSLHLLAKQMHGDVFLAVRTGTRIPRPVDLFLRTEDGEIHQLHASAQVGERHLRPGAWSESDPAWRWGNHVDWIASEAKVDSERPRDLPFPDRLFPSDGVELQVRRARFPGRVWRIRLDVGHFSGEAATHTFPEGATDDPASWAELELPG